MSESELFSPTIAADQRSASYRARDVMRSSTWTGRLPLDEQVAVIHAFAPDAMAAAEQLRAAIHNKRRNDPADAKAMEALKELHNAIGQLIREAERGPITAAAWKAYEDQRERLTAFAYHGTSLTVAAPLAVGLAHFLSWLSGAAAGETMIAGVYGTVVGAGALRGKIGTKPKSGR